MGRPKKETYVETYPEWKDIAIALGKFLGTRSYCPPRQKPYGCEYAECHDCWIEWAIEKIKEKSK